MNIAILNNDENQNNTIIDIINKYNSNIQCQKFSHLLELLSYCETNESFDLYIIKMSLIQKNINVVNKFKKFNFNSKVIFIQDTKLFKEENFIEIIESKIYSLLDSFKINNDIIIKNNSYMKRINIDDIIFVESYGHTKYFYLKDDTISSNLSFQELDKLLNNNSNFVKVHKSYIVNLKHIKSVDKNLILLDNEDEIKPSRNFYKSLKEKYMHFMTN